VAFRPAPRKGSENAEEHGKKIIVFEERMVVLVDVKNCVAEVGKIREELIGIKRDIESLANGKDDQKKEKDETTRRFWSFGPKHWPPPLSTSVGGIRRIYGFQVHSPLTAFDGK